MFLNEVSLLKCCSYIHVGLWKKTIHEGKKQNLSKTLVRYKLFLCFSGGYITTVSGFDVWEKLYLE